MALQSFDLNTGKKNHRQKLLSCHLYCSFLLRGFISKSMACSQKAKYISRKERFDGLLAPTFFFYIAFLNFFDNCNPSLATVANRIWSLYIRKNFAEEARNEPGTNFSFVYNKELLYDWELTQINSYNAWNYHHLFELTLITTQKYNAHIEGFVQWLPVIVSYQSGSDVICIEIILKKGY